MSRPEVSICLPTLNARRYLPERMESILQQSLPNWELIVCDSHSEDGTWEYMTGLAAREPRIKLFRVPRNGIYAGWNECLRRVSGEYIYFATADDSCATTFLARMVVLLNRHHDTQLAVSQFAYTDEEGRVIHPVERRKLDAVYGDWLQQPIRRPRETELLIHFCLGGIPWVTASAMVFRASLLQKTGFFREDIGPHADMIWSLRASLHTDTLSAPDCLATWRQHDQQASSQSPRNWGTLYLTALEQTLDADRDLIPSAWRQYVGWKDVLLRSARCGVLRSFHLNRRDLRMHPLLFAGGCARAMFQRPAYLVRRLAAGLSWNSDEFENEFAYFRRVAREWNVNLVPHDISCDHGTNVAPQCRTKTTEASQ